MMVSIIVAISENGAIGANNDLIWHLPKDMAFFKETTSGHHVLTGRKNYESIPPKYRPLPKRSNIVITRKENYEAQGAFVFNNIKDGISFAKERNETELFIIGGGQIYKSALSQGLVDKMYITQVHASPEGDVFFPEVNWSNWQLIEEKMEEADGKNMFDMTFKTYLLNR